MKFSLSLSYTDPHELIDIARAAEDHGFHGIAMGEHVLHPVNIESDYPYRPTPDGPRSIDHQAPLLNLWTTAGAIAGATEKLHFMTSLYLLNLRHPLVSANAAATLVGISNNRFEFGVGTGWMKEEYDELGVPWDGRGKRFDEALDIMQKAWHGVEEPHHGDHYSFQAMGTNPRPVTEVPLYFGGHTLVAMRRAANRGDGWICAPKPELVREQVRTISELRKANGRDDRPFQFCAMLKLPNESAIVELVQVGVDHVIVSCPWRPDLGRAMSTSDKLAALVDLAKTMRSIAAKTATASVAIPAAV
ncbi:TIGR03619 family F420-dependent LLM class oxidoreductase [Microbacterium lacus]|uniref:TIGR03619 family F420-dependent LLM class oxidoreductase n=1 Tax=Microbacterium lacus TaxID=415217 RepID=UPI00384ECA17